MMPWGVLILHVVAVSALSNLGKLVPVFFYRDRKLSERLALSIGMFTRGEVGAGRHLHRPGIQPRRPGADHLGADAGAEPDPHGRLRRLGQETGPEKLHTRSIISSTSMKRYAFILLVLLLGGKPSGRSGMRRTSWASAPASTCRPRDISIEDVRINTGSRAGFHFAVTDQILLHLQPAPLPVRNGRRLFEPRRQGRRLRNLRRQSTGHDSRGRSTCRPPCSSTAISTSATSSRYSLSPASTAAWGIRGAHEVRLPRRQRSCSATGECFTGMDFGVRAGVGFVVKRIYLGVSYDIGCHEPVQGRIDFFSYGSRTRRRSKSATTACP